MRPKPKFPTVCPQCKRQTVPNQPFCECNFDLRFGTLNRNKKGICIYCQSRGKLTGEHILPAYLSFVFEYDIVGRSHRFSRPRSYLHELSVEQQHLDEHGKGRPYQRVVYNVCKRCNVGWMSRLQDKAKPFVVALANQEAVNLTPETRELIARWAIMVALNLESESRILTSTQVRRTQLRDGTVPFGFRVDIARMSDRSSAGSTTHTTLSVPIGVGTVVPVTVSSFVVEFIAFRVIYVENFFLSEIILNNTGIQRCTPMFRIHPDYIEDGSIPIFEWGNLQEFVTQLCT